MGMTEGNIVERVVVPVLTALLMVRVAGVVGSQSTPILRVKGGAKVGANVGC